MTEAAAAGAAAGHTADGPRASRGRADGMPWRPDLSAHRVQGHRGARALSPENTIASMRAAIDAGATGIELDVRLTADGQVVVWHDPTMQAEKCLFTGPDYTDALVADLTLAQLRTIDVGSRTLPAYPLQRPAPGEHIATLTDVFDACADHPEVWWTVEVKVDPTDPAEVATRDGLVDGTIAAIEAAGVGERSFVHSFDWAVLDRSREVAPHLLRSALAVIGQTFDPGSVWLGSVDYADHDGDLAAAAYAVGAQALSPHYVSCDAGLVTRAHALGLAVLPWTVNEDADIRAVLAAGVDAFVTDDPARGVALTMS